MAKASFGELMRRGRIKNAWTQAELGEKLGVTQATISNWEIGRVPPNRAQKTRVREVLGLNERVSSESSDSALTFETHDDQAGPSAIGTWLNRARLDRGLSVAELASKSSVSVPAIYSIEAGRIDNPRSETVRRLEVALDRTVPTETKTEVRKEATLEGVGEFFEFDPHDKGDWPEVPGIYVLYDVSERPIYVGQGSSIKGRLRDHEEKFWFKSPIVETAAYIRIDDGTLRGRIELILIRFLKRNAVINKQNVGR